MINAPAATMSAEKTRRRVLLRVSSQFLDPITTDIRTQSDGQRHQSQQKQWFFHGFSSRTL